MRWRCSATVALAAATLGTLLSASVALAADDADEPVASASEEPTGEVLLEATRCTEPVSSQEDATADVAAPASGQITLQFTVPPIVVVRLAADGSFAAASTNTGCAPRDGDTTLVEGESGLVPADPAVATAAVGAFTTGDWREPGTWNAPT